MLLLFLHPADITRPPPRHPSRPSRKRFQRRSRLQSHTSPRRLSWESNSSGAWSLLLWSCWLGFRYRSFGSYCLEYWLSYGSTLIPRPARLGLRQKSGLQESVRSEERSLGCKSCVVFILLTTSNHALYALFPLISTDVLTPFIDLLEDALAQQVPPMVVSRHLTCRQWNDLRPP